MGLLKHKWICLHIVLNPKISYYVCANIPKPEKLQNPTYFCSQEFICGTLNLHEQIRKPHFKNDGKTTHHGFGSVASQPLWAWTPQCQSYEHRKGKHCSMDWQGRKTGCSSVFETVYSQASYVFRKMPRKLQKIFFGIVSLSKNLWKCLRSIFRPLGPTAGVTSCQMCVLHKHP